MMMKAPPFDAISVQVALVKAIELLLAGVLTEPLSATELAPWFNCHRAKVAAIVDTIPGVRRHGSRFQVPVFRMPLPYLQETGLLPRS